jgi:DNA polymerase-4
VPCQETRFLGSDKAGLIDPCVVGPQIGVDQRAFWVSLLNRRVAIEKFIHRRKSLTWSESGEHRDRLGATHGFSCGPLHEGRTVHLRPRTFRQYIDLEVTHRCIVSQRGVDREIMDERTTSRKIVHVDMDAFYASVEQRDDPNLRDKPVVVAWKGSRSVVCAASYEARRFGVRSAMPAIRAERLCPEAIFVPPDFVRYKEASRAAREIFHRHTDLVEPLSLDEAYLDVTENKSDLPTATRVAKAIRQQIREELHLTASAGVAPNKFLAKIASDWRKPDGLFVIQPEEIEMFLTPLPVARIPGVGKVTEMRLKEIGIKTVGDLRNLESTMLEAHFGRYGMRLYELARGIDHNAVVSDRPTKSISAEDTFERDIPLEETEPIIRRLAEKVWTASRKETRIARTVVLKLKTSEFNILTRSHTAGSAPATCAELTSIALSLRERVNPHASQRFRLVGVGLSNFREADEIFAHPVLFN